MGDLDHVSFGGETVDRRTRAMLREAQRIANEDDPSIGKFHLAQGSFSHSVGASAGTHDGRAPSTSRSGATPSTRNR